MSLTSQGIENLFCPLDSSGVPPIVLVTDSNVACWLLLVDANEFLMSVCTARKNPSPAAAQAAEQYY